MELVGGRHDGEIVLPGFTLDLEELRSRFESITDLGWNALGFNQPEGPHIYLEGIYQGHELFLQISAYAPEDEEPGMKFNMIRKPRPKN